MGRELANRARERGTAGGQRRRLRERFFFIFLSFFPLTRTHAHLPSHSLPAAFMGHRRVHPDPAVEEEAAADAGFKRKAAAPKDADSPPLLAQPGQPATLKARELTGRLGPRSTAAARFRGFELQVRGCGRWKEDITRSLTPAGRDWWEKGNARPRRARKPHENEETHARAASLPLHHRPSTTPLTPPPRPPRPPLSTCAAGTGWSRSRARAGWWLR